MIGFAASQQILSPASLGQGAALAATSAEKTEGVGGWLRWRLPSNPPTTRLPAADPRRTATSAPRSGTLHTANLASHAWVSQPISRISDGQQGQSERESLRDDPH